jgi:hypothetical protein
VQPAEHIPDGPGVIPLTEGFGQPEFFELVGTVHLGKESPGVLKYRRGENHGIADWCLIYLDWHNL